MTYFTKNLPFLRKVSGLSQADLSAQIGVKRNTISNYENGVSAPDFQLLAKLMDVFGVSSDDFLFRDLTAGAIPVAGEEVIIEKIAEKFPLDKAAIDQLNQQMSRLLENDQINSETITEYKNDIYQLHLRLGKMESRLMEMEQKIKNQAKET